MGEPDWYESAALADEHRAKAIETGVPILTACQGRSLYGTKMIDPRLCIRQPQNPARALERAVLIFANGLRPAVERAVDALTKLGRVLAASLAQTKAARIARYNDRMRKRKPRHLPKWINGRLRGRR